LSRAWTDPSLGPREVRLTYPRPRDATELERFFGCPLRFDQPDCALVFSAEAARRPLASFEPDMLDYLEELAQARLAELRDPSLAAEVRHAVAAELGAGEPSVARVARRLGVSARTLQRRLGAEGLSFRELVDALRHTLAVGLLREGASP